MNKREKAEIARDLPEHMEIFAGILRNNMRFEQAGPQGLEYDFACEGYEVLRREYRIGEIAGRGTDLQRARRLMHHFAPGLTHKGDYDNHVACNALDLLAYSFGKPENGINCLNKAKILQECCMALGIYARRMHIRPYSPYDMDSHVVTEIFDRKLWKWVMIDCTYDAIFVDEKGTPLSCMEMRRALAAREVCSALVARQPKGDVERLAARNAELNAYFAKNLFIIGCDRCSAFGERGGQLYAIPQGFDMREQGIAGAEYRMARQEDGAQKELWQGRLRRLEMMEYTAISVAELEEPPVG